MVESLNAANYINPCIPCLACFLIS
uniref:Uncharacterized protein n=1 Tax=Anguilla anguilla TaxID=7936 RepID=A0A0E9WK36_ANGAN